MTAALDQKKLAQPYTSTPDEYQAAMYPVRTTAQLADISDLINTSDKYIGRRVFNSTTGAPVYALGSAAGDLWNDAAGSTAHTPA